MNNKSTYLKSNSQDKGKKKFTIGGGVIVLLIAITPYLFYVYENLPATQEWNTWLFTFETNYQSVQHFGWFLTSKIIPLYLLLIWFFTCKHWWHWIILLPIFTYIFQTWGIINQSMNLDEVELFYIFPLMLVIIPGVYLIRAKLFNKVRGVEDMREFEEELKQKRTLWQEFKELFR